MRQTEPAWCFQEIAEKPVWLEWNGGKRWDRGDNRGQYVKGTKTRINKDFEFYPEAFREQLEGSEWQSVFTE